MTVVQDTMTGMDFMLLLNAALGTSGIAGVVVALQNWLGVPRVIRRIESLITLRRHLAEEDTRGAEAIAFAANVESFRLSARTVARHTMPSVLFLVVLFVGFFLLAPLITPPARSDPAWVTGVRGTIDGLAAFFGGYAALELLLRLKRADLVRQWLAGKPIRPPDWKTNSPAADSQ